LFLRLIVWNALRKKEEVVMRNSSFIAQVRSRTHGLVVFGAAFLLLPLTSAAVWAQKADDLNPRTVRSTVVSFTKAPSGEVNGCVLASGTAVHWAPYQGQNVTGMIAIGDTVRVVGWRELGSSSDLKLEAKQITNVGTNLTVNLAESPPRPAPPVGPVPPRPHATTDPVTPKTDSVRGTVKHMTTNPKGEVDGCVLTDGTVIHWLPQMAERFTAIVQRGDHIQATGHMETGAAGRVPYFEVQNVTNMNSRATASIYNTPLQEAQDRAAERAQRLRDLEDQLELLKREIEHIRNDK